MQTLQELGAAVANRRRALGLKQGDVAAQSGIAQETLSRFEQGRAPEFGSRKPLAVLGILGMELQFDEIRASGSLDDLRREGAAIRDAVHPLAVPSGLQALFRWRLQSLNGQARWCRR